MIQNVLTLTLLAALSSTYAYPGANKNADTKPSDHFCDPRDACVSYHGSRQVFCAAATKRTYSWQCELGFYQSQKTLCQVNTNWNKPAWELPTVQITQCRNGYELIDEPSGICEWVRVDGCKDRLNGTTWQTGLPDGLSLYNGVWKAAA
jgi:hypothetical protein